MSAFDEFAPHTEYTVMIRREDRWEPVGLTGPLDFVKGEMADWRRDCPHAVLVYAMREVGPWTFGDEDGAA